MKLYEYVIRRLLLLVFVVLGVSVLTFIFTRIFINPIAAYITPKTNPALIPAIIHAHGFDLPPYIQYFYYLRDLFTLNWGWSIVAAMPVTKAIRTFFPATVELTIMAMIIMVAIGVPLGIISALKNNKWPDHLARIFALVGISIPVFWLGLSLQYAFTFWTKVHGLPYLPSTGRVNPILMIETPIHTYTGLLILDSLLNGNLVIAWNAFEHIILPAITLAFLNVGVFTRLTRSSMLEVLRQDYITMAKAYGLKGRTIIYKYALRNALIPVVTSIGLTLGGMMGGAIITESIFAFPGMGWLSYRAIVANDSNTLLAYVVLIAIIFVVVNLIVDIVYAWLDPRIKY